MDFDLWIPDFVFQCPTLVKLDLTANDFTDYPFEYCFNDHPQILMPGNPFAVEIPEEVLADPDASTNLFYWTYGYPFPGELPDWWADGDPEEAGSLQATQAPRAAVPIRTRIELRTDLPLPGR